MAAAYDGLDDELGDSSRPPSPPSTTGRRFGGLYADELGPSYEGSYPPVEHPVIRRHPGTGRPTLFVNRLFTREIVGLAPDESDALLELLYRQAGLPELQGRVHWEPARSPSGTTPPCSTTAPTTTGRPARSRSA